MSTKRILLVAALVGATAFAGVAVAQGYGQGQGRGHGPWWANGQMNDEAGEGHRGHGRMGQGGMGQGGMGHGRQFAEGQGQGQGQGQAQGQGWRQGQGQGQGFGRSGQERPFMARFQAIDENSDKVITAAEAATNVDNVFAAMDQDNSGTITKDEYMAVRLGPQRSQEEGRQGRRQAEMQAAKAARYAPMDTDGDGLVSKAEFTTAATTRFAATDANKDGSVTPEEFQGHKH
jgi:EF hand